MQAIKLPLKTLLGSESVFLLNLGFSSEVMLAHFGTPFSFAFGLYFIGDSAGIFRFVPTLEVL